MKYMYVQYFNYIDVAVYSISASFFFGGMQFPRNQIHQIILFAYMFIISTEIGIHANL